MPSLEPIYLLHQFQLKPGQNTKSSYLRTLKSN